MFKTQTGPAELHQRMTKSVTGPCTSQLARGPPFVHKAVQLACKAHLTNPVNRDFGSSQSERRIHGTQI